MVAGSATLTGEVSGILADPPRQTLAGIEPQILRSGVARYAGRSLLFARVNLAGSSLLSPARGSVRLAAIEPTADLPGVTEVLEISPLPFGLEPVLQRLRGLPTFYLSPFDSAEDDSIVSAGQILAASTSTAFIGALFPDGLELAPWAWMRLIADALAAAGDDPSGDWSDRLLQLYGADPRCRILDHAGRPLVAETDPTVTKSFTVRLRESAGDAIVAERSVTLLADSDLETALNAGSGSPSTLAAPPGQYVEVSWSGAPPPGDPPDPLLSIYETRESAPKGAALRLPSMPQVTLQVLDLPRWYPDIAAGTAIARYRAGSRVEPLVDGIETLQRMAADLREARGPGFGAQFAAWTLNRFPLDPTVSEDDIVDLLTKIHGTDADRGIVRVLATKFALLKNPDLPGTHALTLVLITVLTEAAFIDAIYEKLSNGKALDARGVTAFTVAPLLAAAIAALLATPGDFQWLVDKIVEHAVATVNAINAIAPGLAIFSANPHKLADNPLADGLSEPLWGLEEDVDQFNVWHNKCQMIRRPAAGGENGFVAYLGGIDINKNRFDSPGHGVGGPYHDIHSRITGPVVWDVFRSFEERWEIDRVKVDPPAPAGVLPAPPIDDAGAPDTLRPSKHVAKVGRTYYGPVDPANGPLTFARNGDAGIYQTLLAAIAAARDFIYIEEQYMTPDDHFVDVLLAAREHCRRLLIVLPGETDQPFGDNRRRFVLSRLRGTTPADGWGDRMQVGYPQRRPILPAANEAASKSRCSLARPCVASDDALIVAPPARVPKAPFWIWINGELMLARNTTGPIDESGVKASRVEVIRGSAPGNPRWGATPRAHIKGSAVTMSRVAGVYVHAKSMMIDDTFVSIGSANLNRRGFFSDGEINIFAIPEQLRAAPDNPARSLRTRLWAEHLGIPPAMGAVLLEDPIAGFELFRRSHMLGNRFTPLSATHPQTQFTITNKTLIPFAIADIAWTMLGNLPLPIDGLDGFLRRLWNLAIDASSRTDPSPTDGPV